jgi:hypothetical protein
MRHRLRFFAAGIGILCGGAFLSERRRLVTTVQSENPGGSAVQVDVVSWPQLRGLNYKSGEVSANLQQLLGKSVEVPGFIIPLEDNSQRFDEFFLVPYLGACIHTPPPPPNQIVHVRMTNPIDGSLWDALWVKGNLRVGNTDSPFGKVAFQMIGESIRRFRAI